MKKDVLSPPPPEAFQEPPITANVIAIEDSVYDEQHHEKPPGQRSKKLKMGLLFLIVCALVTVGIVLGITMSNKGGDDEGDNVLKQE
eukprot:CAMPEP_0185734400 /NCGR_PEP_ID=MMETSP1171-20130828/22393_1 /TAXON_ID=374046 /ORGANISM="Helicotheca tamensis, Strain CCMP826" /LENGTH=86 /DNA_ID=CAMNT_0028404389 /DNA_START=35 /DNA_END=292 /DNA_ORIENTATION=-